jgi:hypothetical protein
MPLPLQPAQPSLGERIIDVINPLHHIPFVNHLYRGVTHDEITPDARFAGGFLFGGPLGALGAAASMIASGLVNEVRGGDEATTQTAFAGQTSFVEPRPSRAHFGGAWDFNA